MIQAKNPGAIWNICCKGKGKSNNEETIYVTLCNLSQKHEKRSLSYVSVLFCISSPIKYLSILNRSISKWKNNILSYRYSNAPKKTIEKPYKGWKLFTLLHACKSPEIHYLIRENKWAIKCYLNVENSYHTPAVNLVLISDWDQFRYLLLVGRVDVVIEDCRCARMC